MEAVHSRNLDSRLSAVVLMCLVAIVCYLADRLAFVLGIPPDHIASFWPSTAFLVAVLLLAPRRIWPVLIVAGLGAMAFADSVNGVPIGSEIWITLGNLAEALVATLGISRLLNAVPHLSTLKTTAKYIAFAVILVPFGSALIGAISSAPGGYWLQWRLWFFADALAFLTVAPAILNWVHEGHEWSQKPYNYLEFATLLASLIFFGYLTFMGTGRGERPALLYSLVPLLLWAALRLGLKGVSTSMLAIALLSIWGVVHGRGPFAEQGPLNNALSLQLFLFFAAIPFTVLAVIVEDEKRAQQALIEEHGQLTEAQRLAQMGSWEWDPNTGTVTWSRELYRITGRDPNLPAANYKEHSLLLTAESWERLQRHVENALQTGAPYELDMEYVRPDGSTIWARARGEAQRDFTGRIVRLRGTAQDINERRLAERELALANDRLRLAMESAKSVGWDRDVKTGRDTLFGDLQSVFGIPSEVFEGRVEDFYRYVHPNDRGRVLETINDAMENKEPYAAEFRILWPDGTVRWVAAKGKFYYSSEGEPERLLGMAVDITERKLAEEGLRESEERLRLAAQAGKMYAFDWDVLTDVIIRSEESTHIFGLSRKPMKLTKQQLLADVHPEDHATFVDSIAECTPENPNTQISYRLLRPDGSVLWLERTGHAIFDEQGHMVRMIGMVSDITERKLAEEALSTIGGRLIEAHEEERARIARELHDDIGQRLALLTNSLTLMEQHPPDSAAEIRNRTQGHLERLQEIAVDVQAMSHRLHSSKLRYLGIVAAVKSFCLELAEQRKVEIQFIHADVPPAVPEEISLCLYRVLQEALNNAVKHSSVLHFEVELRGAPDGLHLTVRDAGFGFDPKTVMNNRGLGLISMQERVNLVNGTFSIESRPGRGTTIHVRLPLTRRAESARAAGTSPFSLGMNG
jgi:PAS domain S-box-containing protein